MKKLSRKELEAMLTAVTERCVYNISYFGNVLMEMNITQEEVKANENKSKDRIMKAQMVSATIEMVTDILSPAFLYARALDPKRDKLFNDLEKIHEGTQQRMKGYQDAQVSASESSSSVTPVDIGQDQNQLQ